MIYNELIQVIKDRLLFHWVLAGHPTSYKFEEHLMSTPAEIEETADSTTIKIKGLAYGLYQNFGILPENIPYKVEPRGRGGTSKYITGLKNWVQMKLGIQDEREALGIAFAIAKTHSEEGLIGTGWIDEFKQESIAHIRDKVKELLTAQIKAQIPPKN